MVSLLISSVTATRALMPVNRIRARCWLSRAIRLKNSSEVDAREMSCLDTHLFERASFQRWPEG